MEIEKLLFQCLNLRGIEKEKSLKTFKKIETSMEVQAMPSKGLVVAEGCRIELLWLALSRFSDWLLNYRSFPQGGV